MFALKIRMCAQTVIQMHMYKNIKYHLVFHEEIRLHIKTKKEEVQVEIKEHTKKLKNLLFVSFLGVGRWY